MTPPSDLSLSELADRRVVVVVAHPDDEILGCGAFLGSLADVRVVHVTNGSPLDPAAAKEHGFESPAAYAAARRREAEAALALVDIGPDRIVRLDIVDQQVSRRMADVARILAPMLRDADAVLSHAFEGGHPDHDAVALSVHAACRLAPRHLILVEMPFYHAGPNGWVRQCFLPRSGAGAEAILWLDAKQRSLKRRLVAAHVTQADVLDGFSLDAERFRRAPDYDFVSRPHTGDLLYERHAWNLTGAQWLEQASAALTELGLPC